MKYSLHPDAERDLREAAEFYREHHRFVTAHEIAARLLQDSEGRNLVAAALLQQQGKQSLEWLAGNMVSWFSQRITVGEIVQHRLAEEQDAE